MKVRDRPAAALTSEGRYHLLVDAITDYAIYMLDGSGLVMSWNSGAKRFKGYEEAEILGKHFAIFYTDEDRCDELPSRALDEAARNGRFEGEGWRLRKDGNRFWAHVVIDPIRDKAGHLLGFAKITRDLSVRQAEKDALRQSEDQFRLLVQSVTNYAIYLLDTEGVVNSWNVGAQRIKGYAPAEAIGKHFSMFFTEEDRERGEPGRALETAARDGRFEKQGWRVRKNGDVFLADVVISPVRDDRGKIVGFAKVTRDMTDAKKAELDMERAREALAEAQKAEALGQLTGGVAHDFNSIFRAILGDLRIAHRSLPDNSDIMPHVENAIGLARRGRSLTQRMLALSLTQELTPEIVDVSVLFDGMRDLFQRTMGPSFVIESRFPSPVGRIYVDPNQLVLVIVGLLRNARDAMPDGGTIVILGREEIVTSNQSDSASNRRFVCLSVTDRGDGMDEQILSRATEPFFTTKGIAKGNGLGLSMAQSFAERSEGHFAIRSRKGHGTIAELWLPVQVSSTQSDNIATTDQTDPQIGNARPLVVLVVDDDTRVLTKTTVTLNNLGHKVCTCVSGGQALDLMRREKNEIDLVIIDYALPDMTGAELTEVIKTNWPALPVIFATPLADVSLQQIPKPFHDDELSKAIARAAPRNGRTVN
jgi:PAS domain S-box-containing protein